MFIPMFLYGTMIAELDFELGSLCLVQFVGKTSPPLEILVAVSKAEFRFGHDSRVSGFDTVEKDSFWHL